MADDLLDTDRYPIDALDTPSGRALLAHGRTALRDHGSFSLPGFMHARPLRRCVLELRPRLEHAYRHTQQHDIYFAKQPLQPPPPAGVQVTLTSANYTLTCDQLADTVIRRVYEWQPLCDFLAGVFDTGPLYRMADPLARLNVMGYADGDRLNWHFDRAKYTVTLLLQEADMGGVFQYRRNLRTDTDPNYDGVARLLADEDVAVETLAVPAGTLSVFAGRYAAHRITPVQGTSMRIVAVLSFVERPDYFFNAEDRKQFYGRAEPIPA